MNSTRGFRWIAGSVVLLLSGCAASGPPCRTIPAQLELASTQRDRAKLAFDSKKDDVDRQKSNNEVSAERLVSLTKERDDLKASLASAGADSSSKGGAR